MSRENLTRQDLIDKLQVQNVIAEIPDWCSWTVEQAESYIEETVVDLISAKKVLKNMAKMLILLRNHAYSTNEGKKK